MAAAAALVLVIAVDVTFAQRGLLLGWLYDHVMIWRGLRVPSRFGQIALLSAAVLALPLLAQQPKALESIARVSEGDKEAACRDIL